ncbi:SAP domain-containing protein [Methanobrevibacter smithii]|uniref:SAP domain-containing protein n=1 Tax=Methanobrevibacter smithii TaxID=2173 RepID=UPI0025E22957|nr:SAP domain-containing protein [uncultured Methanobrevibacter sp.]
MINIDDLKGIDFSKKYYDPTKPQKIIRKNYEFEIIPLFDKYEDLSKGSHNFKVKWLIKFDENNYLNGEEDIKTNYGIFLCDVIENYRTEYSHFLIKLPSFKRLLKDFNNDNSFNWLKLMVDLYKVGENRSVNENVELDSIESQNLFKNLEQKMKKEFQNVSDSDKHLMVLNNFSISADNFEDIIDNDISRKMLSLKKKYHEIYDRLGSAEVISDMDVEILNIKLISLSKEFDNLRESLINNLDIQKRENISKKVYYNNINNHLNYLKRVYKDYLNIFDEYRININNFIQIFPEVYLIITDLGLDNTYEKDIYDYADEFIEEYHRDFSSLKKNFNLNDDIYFKIVYMTYLFEVASAHNNIRDKDNLYSNKQISNKIYKLWPGGSIRFDYAFSAQVIKELALYNNHIKEGSGMAILKYTNVLKSDLKVVLKKYNLPVSGTNATLIKRIENNLTINQINQEFPGSRYILTDDGINFCKNSYAYFNIIHCIPFNFTIDEYILLCELNKDVSPEEILFCLAAEDWFDYSDIDNFNIFKTSILITIKNKIFEYRHNVASLLKKEYIDKSIYLYSKNFNNNPLHYMYDGKELCKLYHNQKEYEKELNIIEEVLKQSKISDSSTIYESKNMEWFKKRQNKVLDLLNK